MDIAVVGGGAAGFFGALRAASQPGARVTIYEKSQKFLSKVKVSGGGRCNVTHDCHDSKKLAQNYPRGGRFLQKLFGVFGPREMAAWLQARGVALKTEPDGRMFPTTDDSQTIIDCFLREAARLGVSLQTGHGLLSATPSRGGWLLRFANGQERFHDRLLVCTGGQPKAEGFGWLQALGHTVSPPVPSLFTFQSREFPLRHLAGVSVPDASVKVSGEKNAQNGPLLITHVGFSGPAALKLSAWEARRLAETDYRFKLQVNWLNGSSEEQTRAALEQQKSAHPKMKASNSPLPGIPKRLWGHFVELAGMGDELVWGDTSKKHINRLTDMVSRSVFEIDGKSTFKEEFVTCGGIPLTEVGEDLQSKCCPGLFFAGEVLDIDAVTGGFNFQAAWTAAWVAGGAICYSG